MTSNFNFGSTSEIYGYSAFSGFNGTIPNTTVPSTTWAIGPGGTTTMCFSQQVENPVLLLASLGRPDLTVSLSFSEPYILLYDGGNMNFVNDKTLLGSEGYAIILFPGKFTCVTINSNTPEYYTNITWGLNPPLFPVSISGNPEGCDSVVLSASGGVSYKWNGGSHPNAAANTFHASGNYSVTVTDQNGCTATALKTVTIKSKSASTISHSICQGQSYLGYTTSGTYKDTLVASNGCDSIRTLHLTVNKGAASTISQVICHGQSYMGYTKSGTYTDTFKVANGCDSIRILNLVVNPGPLSVISKTICEGQDFERYHISGTYVDTFTAANGCDSIRTINLTVIKKPEPVLGPDTRICKGEKIVLNPGDFLSYIWQDGSTKNQFIVEEAGLYSVTVSNTCGTSEDHVNVMLNNCAVYFPNAFTPNNDGKNDVFKALNGYNLQDFLLTIYNRWGQKVFETKDHTTGWDGTYNSYLQASGVYIWHCRYKFQYSTKGSKGTVVLIR